MGKPFQPKKRLTNGENPAIIRLFAYTRRDAMPLLDQDLPARAQQGDENALAAEAFADVFDRFLVVHLFSPH